MSKATAEHNPNPDPNPNPNLNQVLFFPEARGARGAHVARLCAELEAARRTLDVAMFTLTHDGLADALLSQHRRGCRVRVLTDGRQAKCTGADAQRLREAGIAVRVRVRLRLRLRLRVRVNPKSNPNPNLTLTRHRRAP